MPGQDILWLPSSSFYAGVMMYGVGFHISFHISFVLSVKCYFCYFIGDSQTSASSCLIRLLSVILNLHFHGERLNEHRQKSFRNSTFCLLLCEAHSFSLAWTVLELLALITARPQDFHCDHRAHKPCCLMIVKSFSFASCTVPGS